MGTKLESLVEILGDSVEQNVLDKLVLDYYSNQNPSVFVTEEVDYEVLTERDKDELLFDAAEGLYSDYEQILLNLISRLYSTDKEPLTLLASSIDEDSATQKIAETLDYEEQYGKVMIGSNSTHTVFIDE